MRILVTFAVEAEFAPWRKHRSFRKASSAEPKFFWSKFDNHELNVLLTGIGRTACQEVLQDWMNVGHEKPDALISSGFAGALKETVAPGDIVVPSRIQALRDDANINAELCLREEAARMGAIPIQTMVTVDRLVRTAEEKSQLAFYGEAVDMESGIVVSHFAKIGALVMALRVISDGAGEDLPLDFDRCLTRQGAIRPMRMVNQIVRRPDNLPNLLRFGRQSYRAGQTLAQFLETFVPRLPAVIGKAAVV